LADGTVVYGGFGLGAETVSPDTWQLFSTDGTPTYPAPESFLLVDATLKYVIFSNTQYDSGTFNIDRDYPRVLQTFTNLGGAFVASDVVPFAAAGEKMLIWQGESDYSLSTNATINFYRDLASAVGASAAATSSQMFVKPGVQHCNSGTAGAGTFDQIAAISNWVEHGTQPTALIASKVDATTGATTLTRPMCAYPLYPRYGGSGDPNSGQSFVCRQRSPVRARRSQWQRRRPRRHATRQPRLEI